MEAQKKSYRNTIQKELISNALNELNHPTADEIYEHIRKLYPNISRGTVYRNLSLMIEMGQADKIPVSGYADRFDCNTKRHYHSRCISCGKVMDIECIEPLPSEFFKNDNLNKDFDIQGYEITLVGLCSDCREKGYSKNKKPQGSSAEKEVRK
ncbi:MAG: transcriptional repressor [Eubacteriales bacterium]|nr:transcriptional repressor [Eubacteriales bacterium]MDD4389964.1 transcriptional repressor [Eubacteriales bacterium]